MTTIINHDPQQSVNRLYPNQYGDGLVWIQAGYDISGYKIDDPQNSWLVRWVECGGDRYGNVGMLRLDERVAYVKKAMETLSSWRRITLVGNGLVFGIGLALAAGWIFWALYALFTFVDVRQWMKRTKQVDVLKTELAGMEDRATDKILAIES